MIGVEAWPNYFTGSALLVYSPNPGGGSGSGDHKRTRDSKICDHVRTTRVQILSASELFLKNTVRTRLKAVKGFDIAGRGRFVVGQEWV